MSATVVAYSLYAISPDVEARLHTDAMPWTVPFVVYGILRDLDLIHHRKEGGSPTRTLFTDRALLADVALWAIHPGGRAILDRAAATLGLKPADLWASYQVLRDYGNMSSATLLFVLELLLAGRAQGRTFAAAFGPGLTVESALLEKLP